MFNTTVAETRSHGPGSHGALAISVQSERSRTRRARLLAEVVAPRRTPGLAGDGLLRQEARGGDHRKTAVRELLLLHEAELGRVLRLEVERVEAKVTRVVARLERRLGLRRALLVELREAKVDAVGLGGADAGGHDRP